MEIGLKAKITMKNHRLMMARIDNGYPRIIDFVKAANGAFSYGAYSGIENLRVSPGPRLRQIICDMLHAESKYLFPKESKRYIKKLKSIELQKYKVVEAKRLMSGLDKPQGILVNDMKDTIYTALDKLDSREQKILKMRFFEDKTLEEIGTAFSVNRERIRQLESRALRKLRHPSISNPLKELVS